jgi:hypothetical protein
MTEQDISYKALKKQKRQRIKGRTAQTNKNKKRQLTKLYHRLYKAGLKRKEKNPQGTYFCDKFKTVDVFLSKIDIKKPTPTK